MKDESKYILNELYIKDYIVWLQSVEEQTFKSLSESLNSVRIEKTEVEFNLNEIEMAWISSCKYP